MESLITPFFLILGGFIGFFLARTFYKTKINTLGEQLHNHKEDVEKIQNRFHEKFENLSQKIFEQASEKSTKHLNQILNPLRDRLGDFQKKVEEVYHHEARERFALKKEIENIIKTNESMKTETTNLTNALRGDSKTQGDWGEFILENILKACGLREGEEYTVQGKEMELKNEDGKHQKPDVIIHLPDQKHIVIDSKVSLTHYEQFWTEKNQEQKQEGLKNFINSIYKHIHDLSSKKYHQLDQLITPEFVLMFVPLEAAYSLALQTDKNIFDKAWNKHIIFIGPSTLMPTLKTIASIWKQERQNQNALEIARQGGALYDKFVGFLKDMEDIGLALKKTQEVFAGSMNKLSHGRGSLISRTENLKELGAKTTKMIPEKYSPEDAEIEQPIQSPSLGTH